MLGAAQRVAATGSGSHTARAMPAPHPDDEQDEALMLAYARGDAAAFDVLYARHRNGVYRYLFRHCGNAGTADELFQDVWMNVIRVRAAYAPTARFAAWLYTFAHHRMVDHWRTTGQATLVSIDDEDTTSDARELAAGSARRRTGGAGRQSRAWRPIARGACGIAAVAA